MCMYTSRDGLVTDFHVAHPGRFALGGFGLVVTEATAAHPQGRIFIVSGETQQRRHARHPQANHAPEPEGTRRGPPKTARRNNKALTKKDSHQGYSVDVVYLCSNKSTTSVTAAQIREISGSTGHSERELQPRVKRSWNRLTDEQRTDVARRYEAGATTTSLSKDYGVAKSTIIGILRERNVVVRRQSLRPEQVTDAVGLYESGLSLSQVAKQLNVNQETMRVAIMAAGVQIRPATGA